MFYQDKKTARIRTQEFSVWVKRPPNKAIMSDTYLFLSLILSTIYTTSLYPPTNIVLYPLYPPTNIVLYNYLSFHVLMCWCCDADIIWRAANVH